MKFAGDASIQTLQAEFNKHSRSCGVSAENCDLLTNAVRLQYMFLIIFRYVRLCDIKST